MTTYRPAVRSLLRGVRARRRLPPLAGQDHHRGRRPSLLHDHHEPPPAAHQRVVRRARDGAGQERGGRQPRLLAGARHERARRQRRRPSPTSRSSRSSTGSRPSTATPSTPRPGGRQGRVEARSTTGASSPSRPRPSTSAVRRSASSGARSWCGSGAPRRRAAVPTATTSGTEPPSPPASRRLRRPRQRLAASSWGSGGDSRAGPALARHPGSLGRAGQRGHAQQTQVSGWSPGLPRFLAGLPDARRPAPGPARVTCCAAWRGLGYNRRALNLHRAAGAIVTRPRRPVPAGLASLLALPGVGAYTARAVLRLRLRRRRRGGGHQRRPGAVPGGGRSAGRALAEAQGLVDAMVPAGRGWGFNQALLDLGATVVPGRAPLRASARSGAGAAGRRAAPPRPDPGPGSGRGLRPQGRFAGSDRQGRGRLVDALRAGPAACAGGLAAAAGWPRRPGAGPACRRRAGGRGAGGTRRRRCPPPALSRAYRLSRRSRRGASGGEELDDVVAHHVGSLEVEEVARPLDHHHLRSGREEVGDRADGVDPHAAVVGAVQVERRVGGRSSPPPPGRLRPRGVVRAAPANMAR